MFHDLKDNLIKLGAANPELRPHIRPILSGLVLPDLRDRVEQLVSNLPKSADGGGYEIKPSKDGFAIIPPWMGSIERQGFVHSAKAIVKFHAKSLSLRVKDMGQGNFDVTDDQAIDFGQILKAKMLKLRKMLVDNGFRPYKHSVSHSVKGPQGHSEGDFILGPEFGDDRVYALYVKNTTYDRTKYPKIEALVDDATDMLGLKVKKGGEMFTIRLAD